MSPRPDVSEERKNQILEAATAAFARLGFQQTRMDDIASQAGLSKGALYLYYKSKDAVIAALLTRFFTRECTHLQRLVAAQHAESVAGQLLLLTRQLSSAIQWMERFLPIAFEFYALAGRDQEVRQFLREYFHNYRTVLAGLIQRGVECGELRAIDPEATAITLVALYEGLALLSFVDPEALPWPTLAEQAVHTLLQGILP